MSQKTAIDSLLEVAELQEDDANSRVIVLKNNQNGKTAKIHLLGTTPYWVSIDNVIPQIERRVLVAGFISYKERYMLIIQKYPEVRGSLSLPLKLVEEFLVDDKAMGKILQEFFIYDADKIFNWKDVSYEIKKETTFSPDITSFYYNRTKLPPGKLVEAVTTRHEALAKAIEKFPMVNMKTFFKEIKIEQAVDISNIDKMTRDETAIIKSISDLDPIETTMLRTGMPPVNFVRSLLGLYNRGLVNLSYKGNDIKDMMRSPDEYKSLMNENASSGFLSNQNNDVRRATPTAPSRPQRSR